MSRSGPIASRLSLRVRLTLLAALGAALVLPVAVVLLHNTVSDALQDAVTSELRVRARDVDAELRAGVAPVTGDGLVTQVVDAAGSPRIPPQAVPLVSPRELAAMHGHEAVLDRPVTGLGDHARVLVRRLPDAAGGGFVLVAGSTAPIAEVERRLSLLLVVVGPLLVAAVAGTTWFLTRSALQPVRRMTRRAQTLSLQEPHSRLPQPPGRDEIAELGRTLNTMLDRIAETVAHERAFVDDASHELRTPIAVLRGELELARMELHDRGAGAESIRAIESALEETDRLARIAEHLLVLARADAGRLAGGAERVPVMAAIARVADRFQHGEVQLQVSGGESHVLADPDLIDQLLTNVVANAARFARTIVRIEVERQDGTVLIRVSDDGPGFDPDVLDRAFDRFSRSGTSRTRAGGGAGLGLAIVAAIVEALGGRIDIGNGGASGGATVEVRLPTADRPVDPSA